MKIGKIIIDPHYCSREEFGELVKYLEEKSWDWKYKEVPPTRSCSDNSKSLGKNDIANLPKPSKVNNRKKEFSINYRSHFDENGTHYDQSINITRETWSKLRDNLWSHIAIVGQRAIHSGSNERLYLSTCIRRMGNTFFINHTQRDFFNKYLKLDLKDRNTCFCIID